jgi:hypothetical protein
MGAVADIRRMHGAYPSPWLVAWSRVMTMRSERVHAYLRMSARERAEAYPWLYRRRVRKRLG